MLTATFIYSGLVDYWGGNCRRWNDNAGCLFATYDNHTTLRDIVDQWVEDFEGEGDCDSFSEDVTGSDVRDALLSMLSDAGRADYESGALSKFAIEYAEANGLSWGDGSDEDTDYALCDELPVVIVLLEYVPDK